jgi:hypothetical protein
VKSPKFQNPGSKEISILNVPNECAGELRFEFWSFFGTWNLGFGIS